MSAAVFFRPFSSALFAEGLWAKPRESFTGDLRSRGTRFGFVYSHAAGWGVFWEPIGTGGGVADVDIQDLFITHGAGREKMRARWDGRTESAHEETSRRPWEKVDTEDTATLRDFSFTTTETYNDTAPCINLSKIKYRAGHHNTDHLVCMRTSSK